MKSLLPLAAVVMLAGLLAPQRANSAETRFISEGTPVVLVGRVESQPRNLGIIHERKMQVAVGPEKTEYTLHLRGAKFFSATGEEYHVSDLRDGFWVRAEGRAMDDPQRIKVDRLTVLGDDRYDLGRSAFFRPGYGQGYVMSVAGERLVYPAATGARVYPERGLTLVGRVTDDTGPGQATRKIHVDAAGNEWTLDVPRNAMVVDEAGKEISVHEVHQGQWIQVSGRQTDDLRMRVGRLHEIGPQDVYQKSTYYHSTWPLGYTEYEVVDMTETTATSFEGTVTAIDASGGFLMVRDADGKEHRVRSGSDIAGKFAVGDKIRVRYGN